MVQVATTIRNELGSHFANRVNDRFERLPLRSDMRLTPMQP